MSSNIQLTKTAVRFQDAVYVKQALIFKEAKHVFKKLISEDPVESLCVVDYPKAWHWAPFEEEIEAALQKQHLILSNVVIKKLLSAIGRGQNLA